MSPTLFINDLVSDLPKGIKDAPYADDLVFWCSEEHTTTDKLAAWADDFSVQVNTEKSCSTLFLLSPKQVAGSTRLGNEALNNVEEATYLGVTFDRRQTWKPHIAKAEERVREKLVILR